MPSAFAPAFDFVMLHEDRTRSGAITHDLGGRTRFGIAEKWHTMPPEFWTAKPEDALPMAANIYRNEYFKPMRGYDFENQRIASKCLDIYVNLPAESRMKVIQQAVCDCGQTIEVDGAMGPNTVAGINSCEPEALLKALCVRQAEHYEKNAQEYELRGLLKRAEDMP
jgi:lysozyme family protein